MTSICKRYWEFMLAQGVCMGLGMTSLFLPSIALIPSYFSKKRALAAGICATGSSIGKYLETFVSSHNSNPHSDRRHFIRRYFRAIGATRRLRMGYSNDWFVATGIADSANFGASQTSCLYASASSGR